MTGAPTPAAFRPVVATDASLGVGAATLEVRQIAARYARHSQPHVTVLRAAAGATIS